MSLSTEGIDHIFARLSGTYMAGWDRAMGMTPIADIKTIWTHELSEFAGSDGRRIYWALNNLPDRPPNAVEFKRLCRAAPGPVEVMLPPAAIDEKKVAEQLMKLGEARSKVSAVLVGRLDWAHRLKAKDELDSRSVTQTVRQMYRDALREPA